MLFASTSLAARIEFAECGLIGDIADAIRTRRPDADVLVRRVSGGIAAYTGEASPINKVIGLGFSGPVDLAELRAVEEEFARRGAPMPVEVSALADPSVAQMLTRRGYVLMGFENVLARALPVETTSSAPDGITVAKSGAEQFATWMDVVVSGFDAPDVQGVPSHESHTRELLERVMGDLASARNFVRYLATRGGAAAGGATMRVANGIAQMCGSATLPPHRRRGVQTALLAVRLNEAGRAGCDLAVVTTLPGSKSQENAQRQGFELLYPRAVLVRSA